jgi:hypothetical protein
MVSINSADGESNLGRDVTSIRGLRNVIDGEAELLPALSSNSWEARNQFILSACGNH